MSLASFLSCAAANPALMITALLTLGVIFVNGWTDAPNAIATCVSTRCMSVRAAVAMACACNFFGVLAACTISARVAFTIYSMVDFANDNRLALTALCAAMVAIVAFSVAAWVFGIPTSESHALIAGLSGAAFAVGGGVNYGQWAKVLYGLAISVALGFFSGYACAKSVQKIFEGSRRSRSEQFFRRMQIGAGAAMAFMHGAQDGQKFAGVFLLGIALAGGSEQTEIPVWLMLLCSGVMGAGTLTGGGRIIKSVGMDMVKLEKYQGFAADTAGVLCLFLSTALGLPVSTTHTKTTAIMGVGAAKRLQSVNWFVARDMVTAWVLTFPGAMAVGWLTAFIFLRLF